MKKLTSREDLIKLRRECIDIAEYETKAIMVCGGTGCVAGGSLEIYARLKELMDEQNIPVDIEIAEEPHGEVVGLKKTGCHGFVSSVHCSL